MTCNKLRHLTVSIMLAVLPEESKDLADLMCHSPNMQQSTYNNLVRSNKAVRSSKIVRKILTHTALTEEDLKLPQFGKITWFKHSLLKI